MRALFLILTVCISFNTLAQDSLSIYKAAGDSLLKSNELNAILYYEKAAEWCEKNKQFEEAAQIYDLVGKLYRQQANYTDAHKYFIISLKLREQLNSSEVVLSHLFLGSIANLRNEFPVGLRHFKEAMRLSEDNLTRILSADSFVYDEVIKKFDPNVDEKFTSGLLRISQSYNNLGLQYSQMSEDTSNISRKRVFQDSAIVLLKRALDVKQLLNSSPRNISNTVNNIGLLYEKMGVVDSAYHYYYNALKLRRNSDYIDGLAQSLQNVGYANYMQGRLDSAYYYYNLSKNISESNNFQTVKRDLYRNMFDLFWRMEKFDSAVFYLEKGEKIDQEIFSENSSLQINKLRTLYETEKKDKEIAVQKAELQLRIFQRDFIMVSLILVLALSVMLVLFFRQRQKAIEQLAAKNEKIASQQITQILKDQELKSINAMLAGQEKERKRIAEDLHDKLGSTLSAAKLHFSSVKMFAGDGHQFSKAESLLDQAVDDIRNIAHNMLSGVLTKFGLGAALEDLRQTVEGTGRIHMTVIINKLDERLKGDIELNIYRIVQELVSNALKHAAATEIIVQINRHQDELTLTVEDDGKGFDPSLVKALGGGIGIRNIESRVAKMDGRFYIDSGKGNGTTITIEIPLS